MFFPGFAWLFGMRQALSLIIEVSCNLLLLLSSLCLKYILMYYQSSCFTEFAENNLWYRKNSFKLQREWNLWIYIPPNHGNVNVSLPICSYIFPPSSFRNPFLASYPLQFKHIPITRRDSNIARNRVGGSLQFQGTKAFCMTTFHAGF